MDEIHGKYLEDSMFLLGTLHSPEFGSVFVGGCSWLGGKAAGWPAEGPCGQQRTKSISQPQKGLGEAGGIWKPAAEGRAERPHTKGFA